MTATPIRVDIISDVVCPWCIIGYRQLLAASAQSGIPVETYWHPFELNPNMPLEGENLTDHIQRKYGSTAAQSSAARAHLTELGQSLDVTFDFTPNSRIYNTFDAHQLMHWAFETGKTQALKLALFDRYFTKDEDVSSSDTLIDAAIEVGLDPDEARNVLTDQRFAEAVRDKEQFWTSRGVSGVPTMIFDTRQATSGAQGIDTFAQILSQLAARHHEVKPSAT
ncbi:DsbA family oxidoreductase [Shimia abyssi]|uniref:Putative DsbA family dithiol-disulfide isomerase n=1 Tax=Shimia abyssi TaxID=1662395 RepID=A0A2P8FB93_9RHOB|nr:DsbA family oxidoreductase [Shimia abyssi]PSL18974.1 putative DsbA family dithiol-disulfide isomerase [Shimia abyssi]